MATGALRTASVPVVRVDGVADARAWAAGHRHELRGILRAQGAVLVRGLGLCDVAGVADVATAMGIRLMVEREAFAPRTAYTGSLYSGSHWPSDEPMCMHHELSYLRQPPSLMIFACLVAPSTGGATAVADSSALLDALPGATLDRLASEGWLLTRNYGGPVGLPWPDAFGTGSRDAVDRYCRDNGIEAEWSGDNLRTRQRLPAFVRHPVSGRRCWFNQISFLSEWSLDPDVRDYLVSVLGAEGLSFNSAWGDGEPFPPELIRRINAVYDQVMLREPWSADDLMLVDNIRMAHSREPFDGQRAIVTGLGNPVRLADEPAHPRP